MYLENTEGFDGEGDLFTRFGVEIRDEATFVVSRRRWTQQVQRMDSEVTSVRPLEGDLVYLPLSNSLFQITHVEHEQPFYQLSNLPVYKLRCKQFEYSSEVLDTGITAIDAVEDALTGDALQHQVTLEQTSAYTQSFALEFFTQKSYTDTLLAETGDTLVSESDDSSAGESILLENPADSGVDSYIIQEDYIVGDMSTDTTAQNELFETEDENILDFSESNPFGDAGRT